mgnify:CR=1 FL=1
MKSANDKATQVSFMKGLLALMEDHGVKDIEVDFSCGDSYVNSIDFNLRGGDYFELHPSIAAEDLELEIKQMLKEGE